MVDLCHPGEVEEKSGGLPPGLYEQLVTAGLEEQLRAIDGKYVSRTALHQAEAPNRIALHLSRQIEKALDGVPEKDRVAVGVEVVRELLGRLEQIVEKAELEPEVLVSPADVLRSVTTALPDGSPRAIDAPLIPLLDTTLLTNAPGEPGVGNQVKAEIHSSQSIDVVMAFIRTSGIRPMIESLREHCERGGQLRVLTTTYTGSTEQAALQRLVDLGAQVRVSYDLSTTRLHAKAWLFNRPSGFSTAYIGSSNLTHSAQVAGLEWNVRISGARNPDVIEKVRAVFDSYWESSDFVPFDAEEFSNHMAKEQTSGPLVFLSPVAVTPLPFQSRLLEQLELARTRGHHRNLLVSATGTGKTVMAALDYARLRQHLPSGRLLFVAHRQEILDQSQATFRHVLREPNFGEQWIGGKRPQKFDHVFASVQSLHRADLDFLEQQHFDMVIVDEFHHAAAKSYGRLLDHVQPVELLGLTATPERSDGLPVLGWFDDRIAAELRLWDAIDQQYLTPFVYYGIHDGTDLRNVAWRRGSGYEVEALTNVYTASDAWAQQVIKEFAEHIDDLSTVRALGFCVSVYHAQFMARLFNQAGIAAAAVWGETPENERREALAALADGRLRVLFSVDLFNEGVDLPSVDALLMLRPTESPTLFIQQLGRGLRRDVGKSVCTVLDFVGQHRKEFRFDRRLAALLGGTRKELAEQVAAGFPYLPAGCQMQLDQKSSKIILESFKAALPSQWPQKVEELRNLVTAGHDPRLVTYLDHTGLELEDVYPGKGAAKGKSGWSNLCESAGLPVESAGPEEQKLRRSLGRLLHIDDDLRLGFYRQFLTGGQVPDLSRLSGSEFRCVRMLMSQLMGQVDKDLIAAPGELQQSADLLWQHPQVRTEALELLDVLAGRVDHVHHSVPNFTDVPLRVHARYTRLEILSAFGHGNPNSHQVAMWQSGVFWLPGDSAAESTDLFAFTLDKTGGNFSPTTRYRDYALSPDLIHWESQSNTRASSKTGLRYQHHAEEGSSIMLFGRLRPEDRAFWFLGPATYVRHQGERPMAITWRLQFPLPGDLFAQFAAAVA